LTSVYAFRMRRVKSGVLSRGTDVVTSYPIVNAAPEGTSAGPVPGRRVRGGINMGELRVQ